MNESILNIEVQKFINNNLESDISKIILKGTCFFEVSTLELVEQIESKKKCKKKLPTWFNSNNIYYPNKLNIEQTSSEITARYKSKLINGKSLIDITGGFGIDSFYFSKQFKTVTYCEVNKTLSELVKHNYKCLNVKNLEVFPLDGIGYLKESKNKFDWIYVDPSRRDGNKNRVFFLNECLPNIPENLDLLFKYSKNMLIKTSPLLDISAGLKELKFVNKVHIVAINNEVKELLWHLENGFNNEIEIKTVNIKNEKEDHFNFLMNSETNFKIDYSLPLLYLYEPNSALLKAGAFNILALKLNINKLHKHSHLYTSKEKIDFPGRRFIIKKIIPYNSKSIKKGSIKIANITTRNFPISVKEIRKKYTIKNGGDLYLFFTTDLNNDKIVIISSKI